MARSQRSGKGRKKKDTGNRVNVPFSFSIPCVAWLRERLENSNFVLLRMPIKIHLFQRGLQGICMDPSRLPELLGLCDQDIERLRQAGLAHLQPPTPQPKKRIDYVTLPRAYARMLAEGPFSSQTELARHLGVSRVWVSRVLKEIRKRTG